MGKAVEPGPWTCGIGGVFIAVAYVRLSSNLELDRAERTSGDEGRIYRRDYPRMELSVGSGRVLSVLCLQRWCGYVQA